MFARVQRAVSQCAAHDPHERSTPSAYRLVVATGKANRYPLAFVLVVTLKSGLGETGEDGDLGFAALCAAWFGHAPPIRRVINPPAALTRRRPGAECGATGREQGSARSATPPAGPPLSTLLAYHGWHDAPRGNREPGPRGSAVRRQTMQQPGRSWAGLQGLRHHVPGACDLTVSATRSRRGRRQAPAAVQAFR